MAEKNINKTNGSKNIFTIGVYGYTENEFFTILLKENVKLFIDIRDRRGMRGSKYKFVNSKYLQKRLKELNIKYLHIKSLAPNKNLRQIQKTADQENFIPKKYRKELSKEFIYHYENTYLDNYDFGILINDINQIDGAIMLFCVERLPMACHRSLVADKLKREFNIDVRHVT